MIEPGTHAVDHLEPHTRTGGSRVVITRFDCRTAVNFAVVVLLHLRIGRAVRRDTTGLLGYRLFLNWRTKTVHNVSLWDRFEHIYTMGQASRHPQATHVVTKLNIQTHCGIYRFEGDWRPLMFGSRGDAPEDGVIA
jgi:hypothetical protein